MTHIFATIGFALIGYGLSPLSGSPSPFALTLRGLWSAIIGTWILIGVGLAVLL